MTEISVKVYRDLMGANEEWAAKIRALLAEKHVHMLNIIGGPGCGKTTLLEKLAERFRGRIRWAVLEGDIETTRDADRLARLDVQSAQLLTGGGCHLEAKMVHHALADLPLDELDLVVVENVGNMVCPAEFDIGEHAKIAVLSVTEGEDKPLKYPLLFHEAKAAIVTKIDLLPHLAFDLEVCLGCIRQVNGAIPIFQVASRTGAGLDEWISWVENRLEKR